MSHWRKLTWLIVGWTALMMVSAFWIERSASLGAQAGLAVALMRVPIDGIWLVGFIVLSEAWFVTRPRKVTWRALTWLILGWTAVMVVVVLYAGESVAVGSGARTGEALVVGLIELIWLVGFIPLATIWFLTRPRVRA